MIRGIDTVDFKPQRPTLIVKIVLPKMNYSLRSQFYAFHFLITCWQVATSIGYLHGYRVCAGTCHILFYMQIFKECTVSINYNNYRNDIS